MKIKTQVLASATLLLLAAGCTTRSHQAGYDNSHYGQTVISAPPVGTVGTTYDSSGTPIYSSGTSTTGTPSGYAYTNNTYAQGQTFTSPLAQRIRQELGGYGRLGTVAQQIQISEQNGAVTLAGTVPSQQDRELIDAVVRNVNGVTRVNDQLQIGSLATGTPGGYQQSSRVYAPNGYQEGNLSPTSANALANVGQMFSLHVEGLTPADRGVAQNIISGLQTDTTLASVVPKVDINVSQGRV